LIMHTSLLSDLIDLNAALQVDKSLDQDARKQRDRKIGRGLQPQRNNPEKQLRGWLDRVQIKGWKRDGHAGAQLYRVLCVLLVVAGFASGWGLARSVLYYTGDRPIYIFDALGLLVVPQILLLLFWVLAAIPRKIPLLSSLRSALLFLNPGRIAQRIAGLFPPHSRQGLEAVWDPGNAIVMAPAARWLFSFWSQLFSVWFNIGVLAAVFYLISFSDLAFVWSTTLSLDNGVWHRALVTLSWPWHSVFPDAVPSTQLIEISRYYRLEEGSLGSPGVAPAVAVQLGGWWPFLVAAIVCYGLLPRVVTLLVSWFRFRHHLGKALPRMPGAPELLARMNSPLVRTAARQPEKAARSSAPSDAAGQETPLAGVKCTVIEWSASVVSVDDRQAIEPRLRAMGIEPLKFLSAGGTRSTQQDDATVATLCRDTTAGVAIITKSWEPPLLEFTDFLRSVRVRCNRRQAIIVLLWGGRECGVAECDREIWRSTLRQLKDPDLHVEVIGSSPW
jgi:Protein of unknown function (DUF2868)